MKNGMDFKHFKKVSDDKKTAVLKHPDGHEIRVAKHALSPSLRDQLSKLKLAEGGDVEKRDESILALTKSLGRKTENKEKGVHESSKPKGGKSVAGEYAQYGKPGSMMDGRPEAKRIHQEKLQELRGMKKPVLMAEAGDPAMAPQAPDQGIQDIDWSQQQPQQSPMVGPSPASVPDSPMPAAQAPAFAVPAKPMTAMQQINQPVSNGLPMPAPDPNQQKYLKENQAWAQDLANGHITPKTYSDLFAEKGTLGKIGMIFGAVLGGAGSGLAHQQNAFLGAMNQQIQNDLQAQKTSKENAKNYLTLSQDQILKESQGKLNQAQALALAQPVANMRANMATMDMLVKKYHALPDGSPLKSKYQQMLMGIYPALNDQNASLAARAAAIESTLTGPQGGSSPQQPGGVAAPSSAGQQTGGATGDFGPASGSMGAPQEQTVPEVGGPSSMLTPNAKHAMDTIQYNPSISPEQRQIMTKEYQAQVNAEAGMKQVDDVFPKLSNEATYGQWLSDEGTAAMHNLNQIGSGVAGAGAALGAGKLIGLGGAAAGAGEAAAGAGAAGLGATGAAALALPVAILGSLGAGAYMYMTKSQRHQYDADRKKLKSALSTALKGVPGFENDASVENLVNSYAPTAFDSDADKQKKAQNMKDIIRLHTKSTFLKDRGLSNN